MRLEEVFEQTAALPSMPRLVQELVSSFDADDVDFRALSAKLSSDPALSARLLRLANSAYYHCSRPISTIDDAVTMLGFAAVRTLVISSGLTSSFKSAPGLDLPMFWRHCVLSAATARAIAKPAKQNTEVAFTVGMMHAIGQLVMHMRMPERMQQVARIAEPADPMRIELEQRDLGYAYPEVGAELARRWRFPAIFADAIAAFPAPQQREPFEPMAAVLHLAVWRVNAERLALGPEELAASLPADVAAALKLDPSQLLELPPPGELAQGLEDLLTG